MDRDALIEVLNKFPKGEKLGFDIRMQGEEISISLSSRNYSVDVVNSYRDETREVIPQEKGEDVVLIYGEMHDKECVKHHIRQFNGYHALPSWVVVPDQKR